MYEKMIRCAEHNHCDLVMCDCIKVYSDGRKTIYSHNIRGGLYEEKQLHQEYYPHLLITRSIESHARNVGIDASCGEYITFIDADDRIPNNYLENLYETIIESGVDLSICTITKIWHSGKKKKIGYSVKARGIARDLFGDEEQYSLSVQRLKETDELLKKFRWILENEELIKKQLNSKIPEVIKRALTAKEYVERLL